MEILDKGNFQIEVGLSKKDVDRLFRTGELSQRDLVTSGEKLIIYAVSERQRDRMVPEDEKMPADITYHDKHLSPETIKVLKERDVVYAKYISGDIEVFMRELTGMAIQPDGLTEINAKIPQVLENYPDNNVRIFVKIPF